jgi:hypothetical protein
VADATVPPAEFRRAVAALNAMRPRPELFVTALDAPPRLAPFTWAFSVEADAGRPAAEDLDEPDTSGRLILLHDPAGQDAWEGTFRLVCFVQARLERDDVELRASWTPAGPELTRHADAFCELVAVAAGLPPVGAVPLVHRTV